MTKRAILLLMPILALAPRAPAAGARPRYDFDGDGKDDVAAYHRPSGSFYIQRSSDRTLWQQRWGNSSCTPVIGDYDGDGMADIAVFVRPEGRWSIRLSSTGLSRDQVFGDPDAFPVQADYDGDGKTDLAVYYRFSATWDILTSSNGTTRTVHFGSALSRPVPADYDGDGKADPAFYIAGFGMWQILDSKTGVARSVTLGRAEARAVPAYFDGDDKADVAVFYPRKGEWQWMESSTGKTRKGTFGSLDSTSVTGDFDGDGISDPTHYNPGTGRWTIYQTKTRQIRTENWGAVTASPVQAYAQGAVENLRIHCHGDSITWGSSSSSDGPDTGYPMLLEENEEGSYGGNIVSLNYGNPGEVTGDGLNRLGSEIFYSQARVVLIMEGTNDNFFGVPYDEIEANLRAMVAAAQAQGKFVVIATIPPVLASRRPEQADRIIGFNPRIYDIARDYGIPVAPVFENITSVPGWETMLMDPVTANHPNDLGYQYVRAAFMSALEPYLLDCELF